MKPFLAAGALVALLAGSAIGQSEMSPNGVWVDSWGTTFTFELCGDGTQLCGVLNDIQGDSRTEENLTFVDQQVVQADQTAPNKWKGLIALDGGDAMATVEMTGPDTLKLTGCKAVIFCSSIDYQRAS